MELNDLTPEQRKALAREALEAEKAERKRIEADREAYKEMAAAKVDELFPLLEETGARLAEIKRQVHAEFAAALELKRGLYGAAADQQRSHTFANAAGTRRITIGCYATDGYDDTANEGIAMVKDYISGLAKDAESRMLSEAVLKLLSKDAKGSLKASRVVQLRQLADRSGDPRFVEGVAVISAAYRPVPTKTFVRAESRDGDGAWKSVPLGMTES